MDDAGAIILQSYVAFLQWKHSQQQWYLPYSL